MIIRVGYLPFKIAAITICKWLIVAHRDATESIIKHEQVHQSEWSIWWLIKYLISPVFRMKAEVRGYAAQTKIEGKPLAYYEKLISDNYMLNNEAKILLPIYIRMIKKEG